MKSFPWLLAVIFFASSCSSTQPSTKSSAPAPPQASHSPQQNSEVQEMPGITVTASPEPYRAAHDKINEIEHTKLNISLDWDHQYLDGEEWITLHPYFYPTDSLILDAK